MEISRISYKVFMGQGENVTTKTWFEVFNTWIHEPDNDVLVDVADYTHVKNGPQTILVGHQANYAIDTTDGRFGFLYSRKRNLDGNLAENLEEVITTGLRACKRLDEDDRLSDSIMFNGGSAQIVLNDRLGASNNADTFHALKSELSPILQRLYGGTGCGMTWDDGYGKRLTVNLQPSGEFSPSQMLENLGN